MNLFNNHYVLSKTTLKQLHLFPPSHLLFSFLNDSFSVARYLTALTNDKLGEFIKNLEVCGKRWSLAILRYNTTIFLN